MAPQKTPPPVSLLHTVLRHEVCFSLLSFQRSPLYQVRPLAKPQEAHCTKSLLTVTYLTSRYLPHLACTSPLPPQSLLF